jgi:hypothetical protein
MKKRMKERKGERDKKRKGNYAINSSYYIWIAAFLE